MWLYPMLRVETYLTPARLSASRVEFVTGVLWLTLMHRFPDASSMLAADTAASVIVGSTPERGATSRNRAASSGPHPYTVIPMLGTADEDSDATDRARQAAGRAGSLEVMPSSQGSRVLPARMRFSVRRRYVAAVACESMSLCSMGCGLGFRLAPAVARPSTTSLCARRSCR